MAVEFIAGEVKDRLPDTLPLVDLLTRLHHQPLFGWRISLLPLLEGYWQACSPSRRTLFWLQQLKKMRLQGEPRPLRLAPLHMDIHAGNLVHSPHGLRLIDWEYAGDGDIAMELASIWMDTESQRSALVAEYAAKTDINPDVLSQHVRRWRPWILMLMAGWYECRWQQTGEHQFITLADAIWHQLSTKEKVR